MTAPRRNRLWRRSAQGLGWSILAFAGVCVGSHFYYAPAAPLTREMLSRRFEPQQLRDDLDAFIATAEQIHPDLYHCVSKESIIRFQRELQQQIDRPMTRKEFYPWAARLAARLGDGHTSVFLPVEELRAAIDSGERWFPFRIADFDGSTFIVERVFAEDSAISPGDSIEAINGHEARALFDEFLQWQSGEKEFYRKGRALRSLRWDLWIHGIGSPFRIRWKSARTGRSFEDTVHGAVDERIRESEDGPASSPRDFSFRRLDGDIGYLEFRRMSGYSEFQSFLEATFTGIQRDPIRGLIIDLRRNGGGSTRLGDLLLSYITDRPYRMTARMELKVSPWKKRALRERIPRWARWIPLQYLSPDGRRIWLTPEGERVVTEVPVRKPPDNPLRYRGPVCVLIGERTFSSAQKLANAIKDYQLATLIGTETGGNPNAFGEVCVARMPHCRLEYAVSTKQYIRANGDPEWRRGILPDIEVPSTPAELRQSVDTTLESAQEWIRRQCDAAASSEDSD